MKKYGHIIEVVLRQELIIFINFGFILGFQPSDNLAMLEVYTLYKFLLQNLRKNKVQ